MGKHQSNSELRLSFGHWMSLQRYTWRTQVRYNKIVGEFCVFLGPRRLKAVKPFRHSRVSRSNRSRSAWRKRVPVEVNVYSHFLARGRDVVYPKDMSMVLDLGTRKEHANPDRAAHVR
jgi:hypothetical protein